MPKDVKGIVIEVGAQVVCATPEHHVGVVTGVTEAEVSVRVVRLRSPMSWSLPARPVRVSPLDCDVIVSAEGRRIAETVIVGEMP